MALELGMLLWAALLALVQIALFAGAVLPKVGIPYAAGARDSERDLGVIGGRLKRAYINHLETLPIFAIAVLAAVAAGKTNATTALAAQVYLTARIAYVPAYAFGVPYLRSAIWGIATAGIVVILLEALF